ncbi:helix-turn-helix domain-containing protein [Nocardia aurantia]|uniref:helix-turn-helix domain-containing protein n=1 Tax=Nocardia aurantia TaxID=2585199 RepID=UPI001296D050|nr:helix-turn-helix transcriptional regulator [Nocardia aurantia]
MNSKEARALRSFGKNIAALRRASGLTQEQLAERSDLAVATIASIEQGKRWARLTTLQRLANALRVTTAELLNHW